MPSTSSPPPSSFMFPFQAFAGNPDPGTHIPASYIKAVSNARLRRGSLNLPSPSAPQLSRMGHSRSYSSISATHPPVSIYRNSAATAQLTQSLTHLNDPSQTFRTPFLSPSSRPPSRPNSVAGHYPTRPNSVTGHYPTRPNSAAGQYPTRPNSVAGHYSVAPNTPVTSNNNNGDTSVPPKVPPKDSFPPLPRPSTRITAEPEKPWLTEKTTRARLSWWLTSFCALLGLAASAYICYDGATSVHKLDPSKLCLVMEDNFDSGTIDENHWSRLVGLGGFGNGEFQIYTDFDANAYINNNQLYIFPELTAKVTSLTPDQIFNGANVSLPTCNIPNIDPNTGVPVDKINTTACHAASSSSQGSIIPPVTSARLTTLNHASIAYGRVDVRAKLPKGDWLWPAIWMLPVDYAYGGWPKSGEIDIMESRGNTNLLSAISSTLVYGPLPSLPRFLSGTLTSKRTPFSADFHTYTLEWTPRWMRMSVDDRVQKVVELNTAKRAQSFWNRGKFPEVATNGSGAGASKVIVANPWGGGYNAPFDQDFYLVLDVAVGGTSGWFPDNMPNKPWFDSSLTAMTDFAHKQDEWYPTWPANPDERAMRVDSVKMWKMC